MVTEVGEGEHCGERQVFDFSQLAELGVLWLINKAIFHSRGYAFALEYVDGNPEPVGWSLQGDGTEPWRFEGVDEDAKFTAVEALMEEASIYGRAPHPE